MSDQSKFASVGSVIKRPDFARGTMGQDMNPAQVHAIKGDVIDKTQRAAI